MSILRTGAGRPESLGCPLKKPRITKGGDALFPEFELAEHIYSG